MQLVTAPTVLLALGIGPASLSALVFLSRSHRDGGLFGACWLRRRGRSLGPRRMHARFAGGAVAAYVPNQFAAAPHAPAPSAVLRQTRRRHARRWLRTGALAQRETSDAPQGAVDHQTFVQYPRRGHPNHGIWPQKRWPTKKVRAAVALLHTTTNERILRCAPATRW